VPFQREYGIIYDVEDSPEYSGNLYTEFYVKNYKNAVGAIFGSITITVVIP